MNLTFGQLSTLLHICQDPVAFYGKTLYEEIERAYHAASIKMARAYIDGRRDDAIQFLAVEVEIYAQDKSKILAAAINLRKDMDSLVEAFT